ncbi:hypothetical protein EDF70_11933 [Neorhizobium sp. JUb45]|nr:hypothetical protein EDF70_11933 [Neorhizobium sp. JUb45]
MKRTYSHIDMDERRVIARMWAETKSPRGRKAYYLLIRCKPKRMSTWVRSSEYYYQSQGRLQ